MTSITTTCTQICTDRPETSPKQHHLITYDLCLKYGQFSAEAERAILRGSGTWVIQMVPP